MIKLLFSTDQQLLAEFIFEGGACMRSTWTDVGIQLYPGLVETWQTVGIRTAISQEIDTEEGELHTTGTKQTLLKSPDAEQAFQSWASDAGNVVVDLPERLIVHWEKLCQIDLLPEERFAVLQSLRQGTHQMIEAWDGAMDEVIPKTRTN